MGYIISALVYRSLPNSVQKVDIILFANLLIVGAYLLSGPSEVFSISSYSESLRTLFAGHILKALIIPFLFLPVLPEMITSVQFEYLPNQKEQVDKGLANINCFFIYLGMIIGPLLG